MLRIDKVPGFLTTSVKYSIFKQDQRAFRREKLIKENYAYAEIGSE